VDASLEPTKLATLHCANAAVADMPMMAMNAKQPAAGKPLAIRRYVSRMAQFLVGWNSN